MLKLLLLIYCITTEYELMLCDVRGVASGDECTETFSCLASTLLFHFTLCTLTVSFLGTLGNYTEKTYS